MLPKICVICAEQSSENISRILPAFAARCVAELFPYRQPLDAVGVYRDCRDAFDGFLFSGWLPYSIVAGVCGIEKPYRYLTLSEGDFFRTMFRLAVQNPGVDFSRVMVDDPQLPMDLSDVFPEGKGCVWTRFYALEYAMQAVSAMDERAHGTPETLYSMALDAYRSAWRAGTTDLVVTRLTNLGPALEREGIPHYVLSPSRLTMTEELERLIYTLESGQYVDLLAVCGVVEPAANAPEGAAAQFKRCVSVFNRQNGMQLFASVENGRVYITTTNKHFKSITEQLTTCRLSAFLAEHTAESFSLGWGVGLDLARARANAIKALKTAKHSGARSTFAVDENERVTGPLLRRTRLVYDGAVTDSVVALSNRYDVSRMNVQRIRSLIEQRGNDAFTSEELADGLGVSPRSARRILQKLGETGAATVLGFEENGLRGRPSARYRIRFGDSAGRN